MHPPRLSAVVINAVDLEAVADFWKDLLEVGERHRVPGFVWLERQSGLGMSLAVQQVAEPTEGRRRLHLDFGVPDLAATAARIAVLGGAHIETHRMGEFEWQVFADVEGNEFCLAPVDPDAFA